MLSDYNLQVVGYNCVERKIVPESNLFVLTLTALRMNRLISFGIIGCTDSVRVPFVMG